MSTSVRTESGLTREKFDRLLWWLDRDRDEAGKRYEEIRSELIKIFESRRCLDPEELADDTINRVASKIEDIASEYAGNPGLYFYGVARLVYLEYSRKQPHLSAPPCTTSTEDAEERYECLERCIDRLTPNNRELILMYYRDDKRTKIDLRKEMARRMGIGPNALRIRACRIRETLAECLGKCLQQKGVR